jgi:tetratricopeptide (TPR) repeat protein
LVKGINLYEDAVSRRLIPRSPKFGRLYAVMGDLEYFTKVGDMEAALRFYHRSEQDGWAPPEMQYRMGVAYYQLENWRNSLEYLFAASKSLPLNRRILFALGNAALKRGDCFAANGYYNRLLDILESQRARLPILLPNDRPEYLELAERLMMAQNNSGVASEMLAAQTGNRSYRTRALAFYAEANRAWDARTRDPRSMIRSGNTPLPFLNSRNALYPQQGYEPQIFIRIDREALENSYWEEIASLPRPDPDKND